MVLVQGLRGNLSTSNQPTQSQKSHVNGINVRSTGLLGGKCARSLDVHVGSDTAGGGTGGMSRDVFNGRARRFSFSAGRLNLGTRLRGMCSGMRRGSLGFGLRRGRRGSLGISTSVAP